jgi:hypothetical protein
MATAQEIVDGDNSCIIGILYINVYIFTYFIRRKGKV